MSTNPRPRAALALCLASVFIGSSALAADGEAATEPPSAACVDGWSRVVSPASTDARPHEIVLDGDRPVWLLGGSNQGALAWRWQDGRFVESGVRVPGTSTFAGGAPGRDSTIWAVGDTRPRSPRRMEPMAGRITPRGWRGRRIRAVPSDRVALASVTAAGSDGAWAVGTKLVEGRTQGYAVRWDGARWQERSPSLGKGESGLVAVTTSEAGDVWAVGWRQAGSGGLRPVIARVAGSRWQKSDGASLPSGIGVLTDVHFDAPDAGWSVGYLVERGSSDHTVILERWDGERWTQEPVPWASGSSAIPRAIDVDPSGGLWIAGTWLEGGTEPRGFVAHRSADGWRLQHDLLPADADSELQTIAVTDEGTMVAGVVGSAPIVLRTCHSGDSSDVGSAAPDGRVDHSAQGQAEIETPSAASGTAWAATAGRLALGKPRRPKGFRVRDVAAAAGVAAVVPTIKGASEDLDGDGWTDVMYWNHYQPMRYLRGGEDGFVAGPADAFGDADRHDCDAADVDLDGTLDMFCTSGRQRGSSIGTHELNLAPGSGRGGPAADLLGIADPFGRGRTTTFIELDGDGYDDLFVTNAPDRVDGLPGMNRFFRNVGGRFVPDPSVGLDRSTGSACTLAADIDGDGDEDLLHCVEFSPDGRREGLRVYRNDRGRLKERSGPLGIEPFDDIDVLVDDFTGDGRADLVQLNRNRIQLSQGRPKGFKPIYEAAVPFATGVAAGDVNGDGSLDLYVVTGNERGNPRDFLLVNGGRGRSFTSVRLPQAREGSGSDVMALDHDHNGLTDFFVLNGGGGNDGPTQLLASYPRRQED